MCVRVCVWRRYGGGTVCVCGWRRYSVCVWMEEVLCVCVWREELLCVCVEGGGTMSMVTAVDMPIFRQKLSSRIIEVPDNGGPDNRGSTVIPKTRT